jgi:UDP-N-acetyl-2-amino-2-deoxyglucuronate dehydrogenase
VSDPIRVAIVGAGFIGMDHAAAYQSDPAAELVAIVDANPDRAAEAGALLGVPGFADRAEMFAQVAPDAVSVCVPTALHLPVVLDATAARAHVLLEKPMAASVADCDQIARAARSAGVRLMLGHTHRFHRELITARGLIQEGRLGEVLLATDVFSFGEAGPWPAWYYSRELSGGGELMHDGVHSVDRLAWLIDSPIVEVYGRTSTYARSIPGVEDGGAAVLVFDNGAVASLFVNQATYPLRSDAASVPMPGRTELEIHGSLGSILYRTWHELVVAIAGEPIETIVRDDSDEMSREIGEFLAAIVEDRPPAIGWAEGRRGIAVIQAIYESERLGRPIRVGELYPVPVDLVASQ